MLENKFSRDYTSQYDFLFCGTGPVKNIKKGICHSRHIVSMIESIIGRQSDRKHGEAKTGAGGAFVCCKLTK